MIAAAMLMTAAGDTNITLPNVTITANTVHHMQMRTSQTNMLITADFLQSNLGGSLMQTIEGLPGVSATSIGGGQSRPVIRGLGLNRLVVSENGVKHEAQQWGDDHGLEIDQFAIDHIEVLKGPSALLYGSDAIGGVINICSDMVPKQPFEGAVTLMGRSVNDQLGVAARIGGRHGLFFYRANATWIDYADSRVPTDSIEYYSYNIALHNRRLRNTAGQERDASLMVGLAGEQWQSSLRLSDSYAKSGFFANAHGLEVRLSDIDYDRSARDIDLPYQMANHLKLQSHTTGRIGLWGLELQLTMQHNHREEHSEPAAHGYMPLPAASLERAFDKRTYNATFAARHPLGERNVATVGISAEWQHNRRGGWGFIMPDYDTRTLGIYAYDRYLATDDFILNAGIRYDDATTDIHEYNDWYATSTPEGESYLQRAAECHRHFGSLTYSAGANYTIGAWTLKGNIGKSFRLPSAKELGANGVNYHIFRYERGNTALHPEQSYQLDAAAYWSNSLWQIQIEPYLNYFSNYIYLNPTASYVDGLQLYQYTEARVMRCGIDALASCRFTTHWEGEIKGEYLFARQLSGDKRGYSLPFSTPWTADATLRYIYFWHGEGHIHINAHLVGRQDDIVPPERATDGYWTLNLSWNHSFAVAHNTLTIALHANNLLNKYYYDHTSYYRLNNIPESGRNISASIKYSF